MFTKPTCRCRRTGCTIRVPNVDEAAERVKSLAARVLNGPGRARRRPDRAVHGSAGCGVRGPFARGLNKAVARGRSSGRGQFMVDLGPSAQPFHEPRRVDAFRHFRHSTPRQYGSNVHPRAVAGHKARFRIGRYQYSDSDRQTSGAWPKYASDGLRRCRHRRRNRVVRCTTFRGGPTRWWGRHVDPVDGRAQQLLNGACAGARRHALRHRTA